MKQIIVENEIVNLETVTYAEFEILQNMKEQLPNMVYTDPVAAQNLVALNLIAFNETYKQPDTGWIAAYMTQAGRLGLDQLMKFPPEKAMEVAAPVIPEPEPEPEPEVEEPVQEVTAPEPEPVAAPPEPAQEQETETDGFVIHSGVTLPTKKKVKKEKYPLDKLEVGQCIFVEKTKECANPAKSVANSVAHANKKYEEQQGTKIEKKKGEEKEVPNMVRTRNYKAHTVKKGDECGSFVAPADGAIIVRLPLDE